jgi:broad specificity phosphatase PhoE
MRPPFAIMCCMMRAFLLLMLVAAPSAQADEATLWALLQQGGQVVLVRHAVTDPGVGDPPGFKLDDCTTQRNLSAEGKADAERLGAAIKARKVPVARVLTSPWCRCRDTARIAFGGADVDATLGNLFTHPQNRERQVAGFHRLVAAAPKTGNLFLITHGATILAFTGVSPGTAEMVILTPEAGGKFRVAGRIAPKR